MSFWDHLEVLRWMLIRVLAVWTVCMLLGFVFVPYLFEQVVMAPCRDDFFLYQLIKQTAARSWIVPDFMETSFHVEVVNIRLASQFFIHMTLSCWLALLVTFPYLVYEIWRFVCPALYEREKSVVEDFVRSILLSIIHQMVYKFRNLLIVKYWIRKDHTFFRFCFSHFV